MFKKLFLSIVFIFASVSSVFAIEEIKLETEKSFFDKLADAYYGEVSENYKNSQPLKIFSKNGLEFENSFINSVKLSFLFDNGTAYNKTEGKSAYMRNKTGVVEPMIIMKFNDNKTKFMFDYNLTRRLEGYDNGFTQKISQLYISHNITPHQTIILGQGGRLPVSFDGSRTTMQNETVMKSQTGRAFSDSMSVGIRNTANYKYIEYDIGLYDSTRFMKDFGRGIDFTGFAIVKPFADKEVELLKNIKLGGGYAVGKNGINYRTYSAFASYDYKKFHIKGEYTNADGYNGVHTSQNKADGFYVLTAYDILPKLSLIAKYDYFIPDKTKKGTSTQEYTAGITYKMFENMKLLLNYVNRTSSKDSNSNMILCTIRFII